MDFSKFKKLCIKTISSIAIVGLPILALPGFIDGTNHNSSFTKEPLNTHRLNITPSHLPSNAGDYVTNAKTEALNSHTNITDDYIYITTDDDTSSAAKKLYDHDKKFMALAVVIEGLKTEPYYDSGGVNIGMGYCVDKRIESVGIEQVKNELKKAGISQDNINLILQDSTQGTRLNQKTKKEILNIHISPQQSLALLEQTAPQYREQAKNAIGAEIFNKLSAEEQDIWTYFAWNTGDNMPKFVKLLNGIRAGDAFTVLNNVTPKFKDDSNAWHSNDRLGMAIKIALLEGIGAVANGTDFDHNNISQNILAKINAKYLKTHQILTDASEEPKMSTPTKEENSAGRNAITLSLNNHIDVQAIKSGAMDRLKHLRGKDTSVTIQTTPPSLT